MKLQFRFENPHHNWSVLHVFKNYYTDFLIKNPDIECSYINSAEYLDRNPGGIYSPHLMTITNLETNKYILVSYWDRLNELIEFGNGWDLSNCVEIITSSGINTNFNYTPFSYLPYTTNFDKYTKHSKSINEKEINELIFRGYLYGQRLDLSILGIINVTDKKVFPEIEYFNDLTNNQICLSLNGAGEICNRDIEILSSRSVLFRPYLNTKFHNELIPDHHYIGFDYVNDVKEQSDIILNKYNKIKDDIDLLTTISENGHKWFIENGTIDSNIKLLQKLININKL